MADWQRPSLLSVSILTLLGLGFGYFSFRLILPTIQRAGQAGTWPEAGCEIIESRVERSEVGTGKNRSIRTEPVVRYRYEVGGRKLMGSTIAFIGPSGSPDDAILPYPKGLKTTCRVNPANPSDSVLDPKVDVVGVCLFVALFGGGFLLVSAGAAYHWWRYFKLRPASQ